MRPYLRVANVFEDRIDVRDVKEMDFAPDEFARYRLHDGDVLLNEGQTPELLGRPAIYRGNPPEVCFTNSLIRFQANPDVDPRWALIVFRHHMHSGRFARESRITTNIAHLSIGRLRGVEFPIPPIEEQRRIVDILEDHLSRLDAALGATRSSGLRLHTLRMSALRQARVSALTAGGPLRRLGELAQTDLGKMLDAKRAVGEPTPYLRNVNIRWGHLDLTNIRTVPLTVRERTDFSLQAGDLLVCEGGEPGRCAIWPAEGPSLMAYQKALHRVRVRRDAHLSVEFLALMLEEFIRTGRADSLLTGTTIKHLPQEKLRAIELPVPSIHDQNITVRQVNETSTNAERLDAELSRARLKANALRRALLQAAFSGQLTGRSSDLDRAAESIG